MLKKVLIIEDEPALRDLLCFQLREAGFDPVAVEKGAEGLVWARKETPSLILLDLMLPDIDGLEVCRQLKRDERTRQIPVLILTAKGEELDRVLGFELGAADYVTKPFSPRELVLRVKAILRRFQEEEGLSDRFRFGPLQVDAGKPEVLVEGKKVLLTPVELKLLISLHATRGRVQSRETLLDRVWGYNRAITTRTVDAHVKRLREKLGGAGDLVETVRGLGYRFREAP